MIESWQLQFRQHLPLEIKIRMSLLRIKWFYEAMNGEVYLSFSGGKDSTVLLHLVRSLYPDVPAVFLNTGLEYPEIIQFVKTIPNVTWLRPKMTFKDVIDTYGYPIISKEQAQYIEEARNTKSDILRAKRLGKGSYAVSEKWRFLIDAPFKVSAKCCHILKKNPAKLFEKESGLSPIVGTMAIDSRLRMNSYMRNGCNSFEGRSMSTPIGFWTEQDIWEYIKLNKIPYSPIYDMGYLNTGCVFCLFGYHLWSRPNKFDHMKVTHPKLYDYCMNNLNLRNVISYFMKTIPENL